MAPISEEPVEVTPSAAHVPDIPECDPVEKWLSEAQEAKSKVITNMTKAQQKQCKDYQRRRPMDKNALIPTGSMVLVKGQKTKGKLTCTNEGPYRLIAYNGDKAPPLLKHEQWTELIA